MMKRSNIIAKQVISVQSALSLGSVSSSGSTLVPLEQTLGTPEVACLHNLSCMNHDVKAHEWLALVVEVRPNLLSGELERCLLEDIAKVGDVLLVEDEHVMENDFKLVGLETLVGYTVVTPGRRNIGKVRGYTFNINSSTVESLTFIHLEYPSFLQVWVFGVLKTWVTLLVSSKNTLIVEDMMMLNQVIAEARVGSSTKK